MYPSCLHQSPARVPLTHPPRLTQLIHTLLDSTDHQTPFMARQPLHTSNPTTSHTPTFTHPPQLAQPSPNHHTCHDSTNHKRHAKAHTTTTHPPQLIQSSHTHNDSSNHQIPFETHPIITLNELSNYHTPFRTQPITLHDSTNYQTPSATHPTIIHPPRLIQLPHSLHDLSIPYTLHDSIHPPWLNQPSHTLHNSLNRYPPSTTHQLWQISHDFIYPSGLTNQHTSPQLTQPT
jgi:hypothetical protein